MGQGPGEQRAFLWAAPSELVPSARRGREQCSDLGREVGAGGRCSRRALGEGEGATSHAVQQQDGGALCPGVPPPAGDLC